MPAFTTLNARMNGIRLITTSRVTPMNSGVIIRFAANIIAVMAMVPQISPTMAIFLVL